MGKRPPAKQLAFSKSKDTSLEVLQMEFDEVENVEGKALKTREYI